MADLTADFKNAEASEKPESVIKTVQGLDELVFELAIWLLLVPKTLFRTLFPAWIVDTVRAEEKKPAEKRYDALMRPALFWAITAVLPMLALLRRAYKGIHNAAPQFSEFGKSVLAVLDSIAGAGLINVIAFVVALLVIQPLCYVLAVQWKSKRPIDRTNIRPIFYIECFALAPYHLGFVLLIASAALFLRRDHVFVFASLAVLLEVTNWWRQTIIISMFLQSSKLQAFWIAGLAKVLIGYIGGLWYGIIFLTIVLAS